MCSLYGKMFSLSAKNEFWCVPYLEDLAFFRSWRSNANQSVDELCNIVWDQIVNDICDNFPIGILGQMWCLIVSVPDLCPLSYFVKKLKKILARQQLSAHKRNDIPLVFHWQADGGPPLESWLLCFNCLSWKKTRSSKLLKYANEATKMPFILKFVIFVNGKILQENFAGKFLIDLCNLSNGPILVAGLLESILC